MLENYDAYCKRSDEILGWVMRGREEGYDLGREEGYDLGREEIIMNMYNNNMTLDVISKATKLTTKEIKKIIKTNKAKLAW